jgi:hypothetical protein
MTTNLERYRKELERLHEEAETMYAGLEVLVYERQKNSPEVVEKIKVLKSKFGGSFENSYQRWYTEACAVLGQLIPGRLEEFRSIYTANPKRKGVNSLTYSIQDWLLGIRSATDRLGAKHFDDLTIILMRFDTQRKILDAARTRLDSTVFDLRNIVRADLFDSELSAARELRKHGFIRSAGVIAGVVLEEHLGQVCNNHQVKVAKKNPTISEYNDLLRKVEVYDVPVWRQLQRLGDLRNMCGHKKEREPTEEEVGELIDGVEKTMKTIL